ncbi:hypothetical protein AMK29_20730 [Streptomyces sp. CB02261]|nr:hypothetical protein AMK29_20730 [Streptomyces sp. CB02261]
MDFVRLEGPGGGGSAGRAYAVRVVLGPPAHPLPPLVGGWRATGRGVVAGAVARRSSTDDAGRDDDGVRGWDAVVRESHGADHDRYVGLATGGLTRDRDADRDGRQGDLRDGGGDAGDRAVG